MTFIVDFLTGNSSLVSLLKTPDTASVYTRLQCPVSQTLISMIVAYTSLAMTNLLKGAIETLKVLRS